MLSAEEWWGIIRAYGAAVWPAQAVFFAAAVLLVLLLFQGDLVEDYLGCRQLRNRLQRKT